MNISILDEQQLIKRINAAENTYFSQYYAFYSSWYGGIIKSPAWMLIPVDDHMVHRGDGVFEAAKAESRAVYMLDQHLDRLFKSAEKIALTPTFSKMEMKEIILETLRVANHDNVIIRLYLSRGPGNFSVNPYDSIGSQFYVAITQLTTPSEDKYTQGVDVGISKVPCKDDWMAQIKSCNYLPNVLMKKEAHERGLEYTIGINHENCITEGFTENIMMVDENDCIVHPPLKGILTGITMMRACELARMNGLTVVERPIQLTELYNAREVMMTGTSLDVLPVSRIEKQVFSPGPIAKTLRVFMRDDVFNGPYRSTY